MADEAVVPQPADPKPGPDELFRGKYERYLLPAIFALRGLVSPDQGDAGLKALYALLFTGLDSPPTAEMEANELIVKARNTALEAILGHYRFSEEFKKNVIDSGLAKNNLMLYALNVLSNKRFFLDTYTGSGCFAQMKKMIAQANAVQMPDA